MVSTCSQGADGAVWTSSALTFSCRVRYECPKAKTNPDDGLSPISLAVAVIIIIIVVVILLAAGWLLIWCACFRKGDAERRREREALKDEPSDNDDASAGDDASDEEAFGDACESASGTSELAEVPEYVDGEEGYDSDLEDPDEVRVRSDDDGDRDDESDRAAAHAAARARSRSVRTTATAATAARATKTTPVKPTIASVDKKRHPSIYRAGGIVPEGGRSFAATNGVDTKRGVTFASLQQPTDFAGCGGTPHAAGGSVHTKGKAKSSRRRGGADTGASFAGTSAAGDEMTPGLSGTLPATAPTPPDNRTRQGPAASRSRSGTATSRSRAGSAPAATMASSVTRPAGAAGATDSSAALGSMRRERAAARKARAAAAGEASVVSDWQPASAQPAAAVGAGDAADDGLMMCPNGHLLETNDAFCQECGSPRRGGTRL